MDVRGLNDELRPGRGRKTNIADAPSGGVHYIDKSITYLMAAVPVAGREHGHGSALWHYGGGAPVPMTRMKRLRRRNTAGRDEPAALCEMQRDWLKATGFVRKCMHDCQEITEAV